jgi:predicted transcriptional regulator
MIELSIDHPVPELIAAEDASTLRAIDEGIAQLDAGRGIPLDELRQELARRCST